MATLMACCASWGMNQVAIKTSNSGISPIFGMLAGGLLLGERITPLLWAAVTLVAAGIFLVNRPPR